MYALAPNSPMLLFGPVHPPSQVELLSPISPHYLHFSPWPPHFSSGSMLQPLPIVASILSVSLSLHGDVAVQAVSTVGNCKAPEPYGRISSKCWVFSEGEKHGGQARDASVNLGVRAAAGRGRAAAVAAAGRVRISLTGSPGSPETEDDFDASTSPPRRHCHQAGGTPWHGGSQVVLLGPPDKGRHGQDWKVVGPHLDLLCHILRILGRLLDSDVVHLLANDQQWSPEVDRRRLPDRYFSRSGTTTESAVGQHRLVHDHLEQGLGVEHP